MKVFAARGISGPPLVHPKHLVPKHIQSPLHSQTQLPIILKQTRFNTGLRYYINCSLRSMTSRETSSETAPYGTDEPESDGMATVEDTRPDDKKEDFDTQLSEAPQESSLFDYPQQWLKFLDDLDIKFNYEETYSVLVFGGGGAVALWFATAIVGAIDSIPVFPKVLELIGLGYTLWFSTRYLIFKENRDELIARIEQIKQQVLGPKDD